MNRKFAIILLLYCDVLPRETEYWMRKIEGMACFFYCEMIWCSKVALHSEMQKITLMPKISEKAHNFRGEEHFLKWKIMKANTFFCGLTCMDELFTTEIAMCTNKIKLVNFDFTQSLRSFKKNIPVIYKLMYNIYIYIYIYIYIL